MKRKILFLSALLFALLLNHSSQAQVLFSEDFSSATLPAGWSNDSLGLPASNLWLFNNPYLRVITGAGFDANFAIFDADELLTNDSIPELASLTTPSIDITTAGTNLFLEMDEQFRYLSPGEAKRTIEYSGDNGISWDTLVFDSLDVGYPTAVHSMYSLSSVVGSTNSLLLRFTYTGDYDWWWAIDNVQVISYSTCSSPPVAGSTVATLTSVCPGDDFTLSLVGADIAIDLTYQWQSSPDGLTWTDLTDDTLKTLAIAQSNETYYQCLVTCSGITTASVPVQITMNPGNACYCAPVGPSCAGISGAITNVTITGTTLNNTSACDELTDLGYTLWPYSASTSAELTRGSSYDFVVTTDGDNIISIWIDFDQNGGFEPTEWAQVCTTSATTVPNTVNILIPNAANMGPTRMRVRSRDSGSQNDSASACIEFFSGESEDYIIGIDYNVGVKTLPLNGTGLYPNPGTGLTYLFFEHTVATATINVYDHTGSLVQSKEVHNVLSTNLDLSDEANGIYFVRIQSDAGSATHKLILNK